MLIEKTDTYKTLVEEMTKRCQELQTQNEQYVHRINKVKKLMRQRKRDVILLKARLDKFHDNWRSVPMLAPHPKRKIEQKRGPKPKLKPPPTVAPKN